MTITKPRTVEPVQTVARESLAHTAQAAHDAELVEIVIDGDRHALPPEVAAAVADLLARLSSGEAVSLTSMNQLMTTSQAAQMLGVSRTHVCSLLDAEELPFEYRGTHRRIPVRAIQNYLVAQMERRRRALSEVTELSAAAGMYDDDF